MCFCVCVCLYLLRCLSGRFSYEGLMPHKNILHRILSFLIGYHLPGNRNWTSFYGFRLCIIHFNIGLWLKAHNVITDSHRRSRKNDNLRLLWWSRTNCKKGVKRWWSRTKCKKGVQSPADTFIGRPAQLARHLNVVISTKYCARYHIIGKTYLHS